MATLKGQLLRRKPVGMALESDAPDGHETLERSMGLVHLTAIGVGATIGTGIFFVMRVAVPEAGPAVVWSFLIAGIVAGLTALCYAELASAVPISGSSYSYAYVTLGELVAMFVAGCLLLEFGVSSAAVAVGWSEYLNQLFGNLFGAQIPYALAHSPEVEGGFVNLPAVILVFCCAMLLLRGASESAWVNTIMVLIKLSVLALFIVIGFTGWNTNHLADFAPFGAQGVFAAAGTIFFSYVGLDAVSTAGEEVKDPQRTMPRALILALLIVTGFYLLVAIAAVGAQPWQDFEGQTAGLSQILENIVGAQWPGTLIAAGAVISIFSVTLVTLFGQSRILFAISRDGLAPKALSRVSRNHVPSTSIIVVCIAVSILAGFLPLELLAEMTSIGTLVAFTVVAIGVMVLRRTAPELPRGFKVPGYPVTPIITIIGCLWIIINLDVVTVTAFLVWSAVVLAYYFFFGRGRSRLNAYSKEQLDRYDAEAGHRFR